MAIKEDVDEVNGCTFFHLFALFAARARILRSARTFFLFRCFPDGLLFSFCLVETGSAVAAAVLIAVEDVLTLLCLLLWLLSGHDVPVVVHHGSFWWTSMGGVVHKRMKKTMTVGDWASSFAAAVADVAVAAAGDVEELVFAAWMLCP